MDKMLGKNIKRNWFFSYMANANFQKHRVAKTKYKTNIVRPVFTGLELVSP